MIYPLFFDEYLKGNYMETKYLLPIVQKDKNDFNDEDYEAIFGNDNGNTSNKEHEDRFVLANSIFSRFGITVGKLINIRQGRKLDG